MAAPLDSPRIQGLCEFAKELGVWLSLGGYHEKVCIFFICQQSNMHGKVQSITWKYLKGLCHCITSTSHQEIVIISLRNITLLFIFEYEDTQGSEISVLYFLLWTQGPLLINFLYLNIWLVALYFCYFLSFPIPIPYQSPNQHWTPNLYTFTSCQQEHVFFYPLFHTPRNCRFFVVFKS